MRLTPPSTWLRLAALLLAGLLAACAHRETAEPPLLAGTADRYEQAFVTFYPLYEMARLRHVALEDRGNPRRHELHAFNHLRRLIDHTGRNVTAPNNDTLYSSARLDLRLGPVLIEMPAMAGRYYSLQFMNFHSDNVAILGRRNAGDGPMTVAVVGPGWNGAVPAHTQRVDSDTQDMWLLVRTLVDGPADLPAVARLQDAMRIVAPQPAQAYPRQRSAPSAKPQPAEFLDVVNEFLGRNPPLGPMQRAAERDRPLGIEPGRSDAWAALPASVQQGWTQAWAAAWATLMRPETLRDRVIQGWEYPPAAVGQWGDELLLRATVALRGIAALDLAETLYLSTYVDARGEALEGSQRFRIRIPKGGLPVKGFWSLTLYEGLPDGRFFLVDNPLRRYSIGNRSQGLAVAADGSIEILVQADPPGDPRDLPNWLPAPRGPFRLTLRCYLPDPSLVRGEAELPRVERLPDARLPAAR